MDPFTPNIPSMSHKFNLHESFEDILKPIITVEQTRTTASTTTVLATPSASAYFQPLSSSVISVTQTTYQDSSIPTATSTYELPFCPYSRGSGFDFGHATETTSSNIRPNYSYPVAETSSMNTYASTHYSSATGSWGNYPSQASTSSATTSWLNDDPIASTSSAAYLVPNQATASPSTDLAESFFNKWMSQEQAKASSHQSSFVPVHTQSQAAQYDPFTLPYSSTSQMTDIPQGSHAFQTATSSAVYPPYTQPRERHPPVRQRKPQQKKFKCQQCSKCFPCPSKLQQHMHVHTGQKPFMCTTCNKTFTTLSGLSSHNREVHERQRPYKCETCHKGFYRRDRRDQHQSRCTPSASTVAPILTDSCKVLLGDAKYYICPVSACSKIFTQKYHFNSHKGSHHHK